MIQVPVTQVKVVRESTDNEKDERRKSYDFRPGKQGSIWRKGSMGGKGKGCFGIVKVDTGGLTEKSGSGVEKVV